MKLGVISLGCDKATVDSERLVGQLVGHGAVVTPNLPDADVILVNTLRTFPTEHLGRLLGLTNLNRLGKNQWLTKILMGLARCGVITFCGDSVLLCTEAKLKIERCAKGLSSLNPKEREWLLRASHQAVYSYKSISTRQYEISH